ncbi:MAG: hypothetical protein ACKVH7_00440, partial [Alphaproteobacteria bacterium]
MSGRFGQALKAEGAPRGHGSLERDPVWPENHVGSISHCEQICCAIAGPSDIYRSVGVDLGRDSPLVADLWRMVCREEELSASANMGAQRVNDFLTLD